MLNLYYFNHHCNTLNREEMLNFRAETGMKGYGIFWALYEMMFANEDTCIQISSLKGIALNLGINADELLEVVNQAVAARVFIMDNEKKAFYNADCRQDKNDVLTMCAAKSEAGKKGAASRYHK